MINPFNLDFGGCAGGSGEKRRGRHEAARYFARPLTHPYYTTCAPTLRALREVKTSLRG